MSVDVSYFFNSDKEFDQLTEEINAWLGCSLASYESDEDDLFDRFLGLELSFSKDHNLETDRELNFPDYKYDIGIRIPAPDGDLRDTLVYVIALIVNVLYRRIKVSDGMLVYDVQKLLARYEERFNPKINGDDLFDKVSNKFVSFPQHLIELNKLECQ